MRGSGLRGRRDGSTGGAYAALLAALLLVGWATPAFARQAEAPPDAGAKGEPAAGTGEPVPVVVGESSDQTTAQPAPAAPPETPERAGPHPLAAEPMNPAEGQEPPPPPPAEATPSPAESIEPPKASTETPTPAAAESGPMLPTAEQIAAKLAQVKSAGETDPPADKLTPEQRAAVLADLAAAAEARKLLDVVAANRTAAEAAAESVEEDAKRLQAELDALPPAPSPDSIRESYAETSDAAVVLDRSKAENDRARLTDEREKLAAPVPAERREADQAAALRERLKRATEAAAAAEALDPDTPTDVAIARIAKARLEKAAAAESLAAHNAESVRAAAASAIGLPTLRRNLLDRKIAAAAARSDAADVELNRRAAEKARELVAASTEGDIPERLKPLAAEVAALQETYEKQNAKKFSAQQQTDKTTQKLTQLKDRWDRLSDRVEDLGLSNAVSAALRQARQEMPGLELINKGIEARLAEIDRAMMTTADHRDAVAELPPESKHPDVAYSLMAGASEEGLVGEEMDAAVRKAQELLDVRRKLLTALAPELEDGTKGLDREVTDALSDLQDAQVAYRDTVAGFAEYIDERVLWVRSGQPLSKEQLEAELPVIAGWAAPGGVRTAVQTTLEALLAGLSSPPTALALVVCVALIVVRTRLRGLLTLWAVAPRRKGSLDFKSTGAALVATLLAAAAGPALLGWFSFVLTDGWSLPSGDGTKDGLPVAIDAAALGTAAGYAAAVWLPLTLLRIVTRADGLADAHFQWPGGAVRRIQRQARWFVPPLLFTAAVAGLLGSSDPLHAGGGWERVAFAAACGLAATMLYRLFRPAGVVWDSIHKVAPESRAHRFRVPLCLFAVAGAAALGGLSLFGYHYTAGELARRALGTAVVLIVVILVRSAAVRWVTISRRAMLYRSMQRRREEAAARELAADPNLPSGASAESPASTGAGQGTDMPSADLSAQTRTLVTAAAMSLGAVALWFIWADVLPALNKLDDMTFSGWTVLREAPLLDPDTGEPLTNSDGVVPTEIKPVAISLWDLLVAATAAGLTVLAAKNLPGLLALSVFDRLPLDAGGRYAVSRLAGYAAVVIGVLFTAGRLGFEWEKLQWLIAALTVGLGFGLQEIVANFVCGVIILFERPVRVGDVVTVGDVTGVVSRIRIRATTITNWDRKEFIVPNKEFVTGRLLNWTLSDATNRIVIEVGVAYGSDTQLARDLMIEAATEAPLVLTDPAPVATFEGFASSSLNLFLRCYLPTLDQRLPVISDLHAAIDRKFRAAGIEIAFPQQDLHLRSVPRGMLIGARGLSPNGEGAEGGSSGDSDPGGAADGRSAYNGRSHSASA
ncbi:Mechanosensitive channel MscK precursor [Alienimonas californiensis]|uniref:Mechanosensitive channel MscK n=2 Tax=Alienimonas californiensis TaxID=2527989 RepID=A0A517P4H7_9PLAN|nr:Mechanosensitive channel MscK precursor [Alienimonas californiensis]